VKETKRQGRIAHHHADATVPHIVALLGFSFHVVKIGIFRLSSKLFPTFFYFDDKFRNKICTFVPCHLPMVAVISFEEDGAARWSTTLWKSDTVRFVFGYLNVGNSISIKDKCRGDAYGCVYYAQPECAEG